MKFIYGTGNKEKIQQVTDFFKAKKMPIEIISLKDIGFNEDIEETGTTFEENSMIKAKAIKAYCDKNNIHEIIVTDDTGLCVDSLNGAPGVYSARYAGNHAPQDVTLKKLLDNMEAVGDKKRTATFVCVLTTVLPDGKEIVVRGETKGKIAEKPGTMGKLTYGPVFIPEGFECVMNDLKDEELGVTHREKAFLKLLEELEKLEDNKKQL